MIESPTRYNSWVNAGWKPTDMNIGTKIGAKIAHFAEALPMKRFANAIITTKASRNGTGADAIPAERRNSAPFTAIHRSRWANWNARVNCEITSTSTI